MASDTIDDTLHDTIQENRLNKALWAGILAGPLAWGLHLQTSYALTATVCITGRPLFYHLVSLAALLVAVSGALLAARLRRRLPAGSTSQGESSREPLESRSRFMALFGMALSAFFGLVILATWMPTWILSACAH